MRPSPRHLRPTGRRRHATRVAVPLLTAASLVLLSAGMAVGGQPASSDKQTICHATNSNHNPYVVNTPAKDGDLDGHAGHPGPLWNSSLKAQHVSWGDIIPPFDYLDGETVLHFDGLNWSTAGQAIFDTGCAVPPPVLTLTIDKTNDGNNDTAFHDQETAATVGADVTFHVLITNTSAVSVVVDSVTDLVGTTSIPVSCTNAVVGTTLAPDASTTCAFTATGYTPADGQSTTNTATVTVHEGPDGDEGDEDPANTAKASDTSVVTTQLAPPALSLTVTKTNDASGDATYSPTETAPRAGLDVPYRVVVTNTSAVTVALDALSDAVGATAGTPVTCATALPATLAAGASATCDFTLATSSPAAGGSLSDTVTAAIHQLLDSENSAVATATSTVLTAEAPLLVSDLSVVKVGPTGSLTPGGDATYTLTVTNDGTGPASSVVLDDPVPAGTTVSSVVGTGWSCATDGIHCVLDDPLAAGGSAAVTVVLALDSDYAPSTLVNTAVVSPTDETPADNTSTVTNDVLHAPDLSIVKTGPATVAPGTDLTWTLTVTNDGTAAAPAASVTDTLPAGVTAGAVSATGWTCTGSTDLSCTLDTPLAAGDSASLTVTAGVPTDFAAATISNTAVVGPDDSTPDDNTSTVVTAVGQTTAGGGGVVTPTTDPAEADTFTGGGGTLAVTGAPVSQWAALAGGLVLLGLALVTAGRRRA